MSDPEPTPPAGPPHALADAADLPSLLELVRKVVRQLAAYRMGPELAAHEAPSDLAQSVVLEVLKHADALEYRGEAATRALAKTMLVRKLAQRVRASRTKKRGGRAPERLLEASDSTPGLTPAAPQPGPASVVADRDLLDHIASLARRLDERERQILELHLNGKTHAEIGERFGVSADYAQRLLARTQAILRKQALD